MIVAGFVLAGLVAAAIIFIGARFILAPITAARGFGVRGPLEDPTDFSPWLCVKGSRDIASGLFVILLMIEGSPRLLGELLIVAAIIPIGDAVMR